MAGSTADSKVALSVETRVPRKAASMVECSVALWAESKALTKVGQTA